MSFQVELKNIAKDFKTFRAVDHINLEIEKGEIVSLLGASGCGKTTTLRMIAGLIAPTEGSVLINGKDVTALPPYKRDVSMVFQNYALFPHMTVYENIVYGLRNRKIRDKATLDSKAAEVLRIVQLVGQETKYPRQLSGGQQQRVSLARALVVQPQVMLFDEPLSNLDAKLRVQTRTEIRSLLKMLGVTAVYVTHDQEEALTISDRIAVMHRGKIEQISLPAELYRSPKSRFVADFIGQANLFEGAAEASGQQTLLALEDGAKIRCTPEPGVTAQGKRCVLVRPESIRITADATTLDNCFPAAVVQSSFLGNTVRYEVSLGNHRTIVVQAHPDDPLLPGGASVFVSFPAEKAILLDS